jgi:hypothetical protein
MLPIINNCSLLCFPPPPFPSRFKVEYKLQNTYTCTFVLRPEAESVPFISLIPNVSFNMMMQKGRMVYFNRTMAVTIGPRNHFQSPIRQQEPTQVCAFVTLPRGSSKRRNDAYTLCGSS